MKQTNVSLISIFFLSIFLCSCSNRDQVKVVDTNFKGEVEQQQNLIFQFNKDIYPDSLLNTWDSTKYVAFEPTVSGSFRWNQSNELIFSPTKGFAPGVEYKAILTPHLLSKTKKKTYTLGSERTLSFHTAPLKVVEASALWTRGKQASNVMVQLNLDFNYETDVTQAASKLKLSANGANVSFNTINSEIGKTVSVQFNPINNKDETVDLKVNLESGIAIAKSKISSRTDTSFTTQIASRYELKVTGNDAKHDGTQGIIDVDLSQPVAEQGLHNLITIEPAVLFDVKVNDAGFTLTSLAFDPQTTYNITLDKRMTGEYGGKLKDDKTVQANFGTLDPTISFTNAKGMYLSSKGFRNLALNIVEVQKVEVTVVKVYENNLLQLFSKGTSWQYDYNENDDYNEYEYYNTENLGDTVYTQSYDVDKLPKNNAAHLLHLDFADKLRSYDGVYVITVASTNQKWVQQSKILSLSDIGLIAKQEQNKIYVFANSIRNASPISGAKISFISTTNQMVFSATTNNDGVATLDDMATKIPGFTIGMISAKSAG